MYWVSDIWKMHRNKPYSHDWYEYWLTSMLNTAQEFSTTSNSLAMPRMYFQTSWWLCQVSLVVFQAPTGLLSAEILFLGCSGYIRKMRHYHGWSLVPRAQCCRADGHWTDAGAAMALEPHSQVPHCLWSLKRAKPSQCFRQIVWIHGGAAWTK